MLTRTVILIKFCQFFLQGIKHRSTTRETRYPWKTREESKHGQMPSGGGEGRCCINLTRDPS